ncbi:enoyl-CoA hydratase/isomerase family protein [Pararhizobium haloflavum]|uniref:enoyl-CoA hydratase/isomerase family protein n=1 Tax=Pararhizobium haloflavum TaxID=2037914 RepID=UPI000C19F6AC|nr:enoyl-CoA hydratase/isomerase family protein [Pararhizobium haloflavum]
MPLQSQTATDAPVLFETGGSVARITLNRPEARNALTFDMYERLADICRSIDPNGPIRAVIITGAGEKAFAAGTDIAQFRDFDGADDAIAYEERIEKVLEAVETCPAATIAAISGACTGGGAGIAAACDIRIATRSLKFGFPIARTLGNCLSISNYARLAAMMGSGRVMDLIFTARLVEADEAKAIGVISEILDDHAALMSRADELAATLSGHAPLTLRATREALRRVRAGRRDDEDLIALCYTSADFREGLEAFLAKRRPNWTGR